MRTWKERIIEAMTGQNNEGAYLWYSHNKIVDELNRITGTDTRLKYKHGFAVYLLELVKSGHVERTLKPKHLSTKVVPDREYLYRLTGKPFVRGGAIYYGMQGHDLWRKHRKLPKWFRKMMYD